ncbi:hypothetical protein L596_011828 [Steinernema carpocapsae]|uniref:G-protein coupled receptors family 1 profile domain-containing protein n=1 Tax=Steinernema carpocapsae TaxID=34508 RepID=A0A4U5NV92_STECR|nr:hypothetical protein L596_011828 [Steinernema carpocapsae]
MESSWIVAEHVVVWVEVVGFLLSIPMDFYLILCLRKTSLLHGNLKVILINLSFALLLIGSTRCGIYVDRLLQRHGVGVDNIACRLQQWILRLFYDSACYTASASMFLVTIERTFATFIPKTYEQRTGVRRVSLLNAVIWTICIGVAAASQALFSVHVSSCESFHAPPSTSVMYAKSSIMLYLAGIATAGVTFAACILTVLLICNKRRRKACNIGQLNLRYQFSENISTIRFLMPIVAFYAVLLAVAIVIVVSYHLERHSENQNIAKLRVLEQTLNTVAALFGVLFPIIACGLHRPMKDKVKKDFSFLLCCTEEESKKPKEMTMVVKSVSGKSLVFTDERAVHFHSLSEGWNAYAKKENLKRKKKTSKVFFSRKQHGICETKSPTSTRRRSLGFWV